MSLNGLDIHVKNLENKNLGIVPKERKGNRKQKRNKS